MPEETRSTTAGSGADETTGGAEPTGNGGPAEEAGERASGEGGRGRSWSGLWELQETVTEMVDSAIRGLAPAGARFPRHDLVRLPSGGYRISFDLPGVAKADLDVTTVGDELTVSGERRRPELPEGAEVLRSERGFGRFRRTVRMPPDVDAGGVRARLDDGVLDIMLPRRGDSREQTIEVEG